MSRAATRRTCLPAAIALLLTGAFRVVGQEPTILAGAAFTRTAFGMTFDVPARDRTRVDEVFAGLGWLPSGPDGKTLNPEAAFLLWRQRDGSASRLRAVLVGIYDDVRWNRRIAENADLVLTFENTTFPWARSEYAGGERLKAEELQWHSIRAGAGVAYRVALEPGHPDNSFEGSLSYEPGALYFSKNSSTAMEFTPPSNAYEGRLHGRVRADALTRNLLELPHLGWAAGLDAWAAHRAGWQDWGGGPTGAHAAADTRSWTALAGFALAALPLPLGDRRHRILASVYAGTGSNLDRFSAFRLSGGSNAGDYETITRPVLPTAGLDEIVSRGYVIANLEARLQLAFFLFLHLKGTLASVDRTVRDVSGALLQRTDGPNAVTIGLTSGFFWSSELELSWSRSAALESRDGDGFTPGRDGVYFSFTKTF
ncbi:MAG: hypothetical protein ABI768_13665 [Acidobacteriota bacterium]